MEKSVSWKKILDLKEYVIEENEEAIRVIDIDGNLIVKHNKNENYK